MGPVGDGTMWSLSLAVRHCQAPAPYSVFLLDKGKDVHGDHGCDMRA